MARLYLREARVSARRRSPPRWSASAFRVDKAMADAPTTIRGGGAPGQRPRPHGPDIQPVPAEDLDGGRVPALPGSPRRDSLLDSNGVRRVQSR